jgi:hypothetical protein
MAFELVGQFADAKPVIGSVVTRAKCWPSVEEYNPCRRMKA